MVEVIKVIDFTDVFVRMKEILYIKVKKCTAADKVELFRLQKPSKPESLIMAKTVCSLNLFRQQPRMMQLSN